MGSKQRRVDGKRKFKVNVLVHVILPNKDYITVMYSRVLCESSCGFYKIIIRKVRATYDLL